MPEFEVAGMGGPRHRQNRPRTRLKPERSPWKTTIANKLTCHLHNLSLDRATLTISFNRRENSYWDLKSCSRLPYVTKRGSADLCSRHADLPACLCWHDVYLSSPHLSARPGHILLHRLFSLFFASYYVSLTPFVVLWPLLTVLIKTSACDWFRREDHIDGDALRRRQSDFTWSRADVSKAG